MSALKADPESYSKFSIVSPFLKDNLFSCAQLETFRWVHTHHHVYMSYHYIFETVVHASAEPKLGMSCNSQKSHYALWEFARLSSGNLRVHKSVSLVSFFGY